MALAARVAPSTLGNVLAVAEYRLMRFRRSWTASLFSTVASPVLFLVAMGIGVGELVEDNPAAALPADDYATFVAPGLLAATAMNIAVNEATWPILASVKWVPVAFSQVATPARPRDVATGNAVYLGARLIVAAAIFVAVMAIFGVIGSWLVIGAIGAAVLTGLAYFTPIMAWAVTLDVSEYFPPLHRYVIMPMFLFSGTFFPIEQLPTVGRVVAYLTPLWHGVRLCRELTAGTAVGWEVLGHTAVLVAMVAVGLVFAQRNYERRLAP